MSRLRTLLSKRCIVVTICSGLVLFTLLTASLAVEGSSSRTLREGDTGPDVERLQAQLYEAGLMASRPTGYFGTATMEAVRALQRKQGLASDGIFGRGTSDALESLRATTASSTYVVQSGDNLWTIARRFDMSVSDLAASNGLKEDATLGVGTDLRVPGRLGVRTVSRGMVANASHPLPLPWDQVNGIYTSTCTITDVQTGLTFSGVRRGGTLHADTEPLTAEDTRTLKEIYGGRWSWGRRAVVVHVNGLSIAASINGMPHGGEKVTENGFPGHFCVHFLGSRTHGTGKVDPDHQAMIRAAARS